MLFRGKLRGNSKVELPLPGLRLVSLKLCSLLGACQTTYPPTPNRRKRKQTSWSKHAGANQLEQTSWNKQGGANKLEQTWLSKYFWSTNIILDQGTEFTKEVIEMIEKDYGITRQSITTRNPQENPILERAHQTISNILRTFQVNNSKLDLDDPWIGILLGVIFAMRSTVHTTTQATPIQLVFGHDAIMNLTFDAN